MAGALLLSLILSLPGSQAQLPLPIVPEEEAIHLAVLCDSAFFEPNQLERDTVGCTIHDFSRDSAAIPGSNPLSPSVHTATLSARPAPGFENDTGWQVLITPPTMSLRGGEARPVDIHVTPTAAILADEYRFDFVVDYQVQTGFNETITFPMVAQVNPFGRVVTSWLTSQSQKAGQDEVVRYELAIKNDGVYPDSYAIDVTAHPALRISPPPDVYVGPGETATVVISALTPRGKLYEWGLTTPVLIRITSMGVGDVPGTGVYTAAATLQVRGAYVPVYWIPLLLVGLVSTAFLVRGSTEKRRFRRLERGAPRPVAITPRQAVLLAELKRQDRDAYKEKQASLDAVYKERVGDYRSHRRERLAADRAEAKLARAEFAAQKKARKARRREEKIAKAQARREARVEAAEIRKREKLLAKARKKLAKAQKKQAKIDAKLAKKQAKIDAKQAAKDAKAAAAAAKAEAKAAKAAAKAAKKQEKNQQK